MGATVNGVRGRGLRVPRVVLLALSLLPLAGCTNFFQCENKAACPSGSGTGTGGGTGGGGNSSVDYAYVTYTSTSGTSTLVGYSIASGALTQVASLTLAYIPVAIAVSPNDDFLYVASAPGYSSPGIYGFAIGPAGGLSALNGGNALFTDTVSAMAISPDGQYLYTVNSLGLTMAQYTANTSTGLIATAGVLTLPSLTCSLGVGTPVTQTCSVAVSPAADRVVASLGTAGDAVFDYATGSGITNNGAFTTIPAGASSGDFSVAIDGNDNAYIAQTAGLTVYQFTSTGYTNRGTVTYASGAVPRGVVASPNSSFVFTANEGTGTISAYTTGTSTALNAVTGSPFTGPANVAALGVDRNSAYLVAVGYDANAGVQLWSIASGGVLTEVTAAASSTATQYPVLVAMSH